MAKAPTPPPTSAPDGATNEALTPAPHGATNEALTPAPHGATDTARPTEPILRVTSPGGPHWRAGRQFGREVVELTGADLEAMAGAKGVGPDEILRSLFFDDQLSVVRAERPITAAD